MVDSLYGDVVRGCQPSMPEHNGVFVLVLTFDGLGLLLAVSWGFQDLITGTLVYLGFSE